MAVFLKKIVCLLLVIPIKSTNGDLPQGDGMFTFIVSTGQSQQMAVFFEKIVCSLLGFPNQGRQMEIFFKKDSLFTSNTPSTKSTNDCLPQEDSLFILLGFSN